MKHMMPELKDNCVDELLGIKEELQSVGYVENENLDYDDLIQELVEKTVVKVQKRDLF